MPRPQLKKYLPIVILVLLYLGGRQFFHSRPRPVAVGGNHALLQAFQQRQSNVQVQGRGVIVKVLPDDRRGRRHQRFLVRLDDRLTVLIAHNIDLAPRVAKPAPGQEIAFAGEYEWNRQGGVVHWTHHDPRGRHPDGWLLYQGQKYR
ncbi:MAG: DUF3465 domain-containing protein [Deltaproteobacteria bacterium]|nr:DUF3465 domain-containing protein [Deltaproteobacteria bacterium]